MKLCCSLHQARQKSSGYTLLELLIVLVILGVLISVAGLSITSVERNPAEEALQRLKFDVDLALNESIVRSEPLAMVFADDGYGFYAQDEKTDQWVLIKDDGLLSKRELAKGLKTRLLIEQNEVSLPPELVDELESEWPEEASVVLIEPSGEMTPFSYQIMAEKKSPAYASFNSMGQVEADLEAADAETKDDKS